MTLAEYLDKQGISARELGRQLGTSHETVRQWRLGNAIPQLRYMKAIMAITDGAVRPQDFYAEDAS